MAHNTFYINFNDEINIANVKKLMIILTEARVQAKPDTFYFLFSSNGGSVDAGIHLYQFLKALPEKIIMHNIGCIDSIANVVFLAGEERYATEHSSFLLHGVTWSLTGSFTLHQLQEAVSLLKQSHKKIAGIYGEHTSLLEADTMALFAQGESKDSKWALDNGFISDICNHSIPPEAKIFSCNF